MQNTKFWKTPLLFALAVLPIAFLSGILVIWYQVELFSPDIVEELLSQLGTMDNVFLLGGLQAAGYAVVCAFFGCIFAGKLGLWRPLRIQSKPLGITLLSGLGFGILFSLDYWVFGGAFPAIQESTPDGLTPVAVLASLLYGGIVEELMLRLFFLSLIALLIWKIFFRKVPRENIPTLVFILANILSALTFAAGHLPATYVLFGELTPLLLFRCFLMNGGFGLYFGWLYRKHGIQYAMIGHAALHAVSKAVWILFL